MSSFGSNSLTLFGGWRCLGRDHAALLVTQEPVSRSSQKTFRLEIPRWLIMIRHSNKPSTVVMGRLR